MGTGIKHNALNVRTDRRCRCNENTPRHYGSAEYIYESLTKGLSLQRCALTAEETNCAVRCAECNFAT